MNRKRKCAECNKHMSWFEGHHHPMLGSKVIVCSNCYDKLSKVMSEYCKTITKNKGVT